MNNNNRCVYFSEDELRCKGTGEIHMDEDFMTKLVALRKELNQSNENKRPDINFNANEKLAFHCRSCCCWCLGILWCH